MLAAGMLQDDAGRSSSAELTQPDTSSRDLPHLLAAALQIRPSPFYFEMAIAIQHCRPPENTHQCCVFTLSSLFLFYFSFLDCFPGLLLSLSVAN